LAAQGLRQRCQRRSTTQQPVRETHGRATSVPDRAGSIPSAASRRNEKLRYVPVAYVDERLLETPASFGQRQASQAFSLLRQKGRALANAALSD
jgi:hypothetical protein